MSTTNDRDADVVELIEQYTEIRIPDDPADRDTFSRVLVEIGAAALDFEEQHDKPDNDLVIAFEVISAAFARVQETDMEANQ